MKINSRKNTTKKSVRPYMLFLFSVITVGLVLYLYLFQPPSSVDYLEQLFLNNKKKLENLAQSEIFFCQTEGAEDYHYKHEQPKIGHKETDVMAYDPPEVFWFGRGVDDDNFIEKIWISKDCTRVLFDIFRNSDLKKGFIYSPDMPVGYCEGQLKPHAPIRYDNYPPVHDLDSLDNQCEGNFFYYYFYQSLGNDWYLYLTNDARN